MAGSVTLTLTAASAEAGNFSIYHTSADPGNLLAQGVTLNQLSAGYCTEQIYPSYVVVSNTEGCQNQVLVQVGIIPTATPVPTSTPVPTGITPTSTPNPTVPPPTATSVGPTPTPTSTSVGPTPTPVPSSTPTPSGVPNPTSTPAPTVPVYQYEIRECGGFTTYYVQIQGTQFPLSSALKLSGGQGFLDGKCWEILSNTYQGVVDYNATFVSFNSSCGGCAPEATATPVPTPVPTSTPIPTTYYARFVTCDDPTGLIIQVQDSNPIPTSGLILKDNGDCYRYYDAGGVGVDGDIDTFQQFISCADCYGPEPTPFPTPQPTALCTQDNLYVSLESAEDAYCTQFRTRVVSHNGTGINDATEIYSSTACDQLAGPNRWYSNGLNTWYWTGASLILINNPNCP